MDEKGRKQLLALNQQFYQKMAQSFSDTRQTPWKGWQKFLPMIQNLPDPIRVLDIGCGNGRLGTFLADWMKQEIMYTGIDESQKLLDEAEKRLQLLRKKTFIQGSLTQALPKVASDAFDLVVMIAIMHHIPTLTARIKLLQEAGKQVRRKGVLIVSFWQFMNIPSLSQHALDLTIPQGMKLAHITKPADHNDYLLPWQKSDLRRYCHHFDDDEIASLIGSIKLTLTDRFQADGFEGKANCYLIFKKP